MMLSEAWIDFASGWISGGISVLVIQPIDTILTRLQASTAKVLQHHDVAAKVSKTCVQTSVNAATSTTAVTLRPSAIARSMISDFGISSLWRGSSAMIGAVPLQNALLMTGYGVGKRFSVGDDETDKGSTSEVLFGVFIGGCTGEFFDVSYSPWNVRTQRIHFLNICTILLQVEFFSHSSCLRLNSSKFRSKSRTNP
jgi:solute carrier family 25 carnitine/acylcarnitine transporter 20/29